MSYPTLYFGVELEFNVAYLYPGLTSKDQGDIRPSRFEPSEDDFQQVINRFNRPHLTMNDLFNVPETSSLSIMKEILMKHTIYQAIFDSIRAAGLPITQPPIIPNMDPITNDLQSWAIDSDTTVEPPDDRRYRWLGVEICSPAYEFTAENLKNVQNVCNLLNANFLTDTNETTGLHVHVSFGLHNKWTFHSLQRVMMFFWAFHHQFDTIHPDHRQGSHRYAQSMRSASSMATNFLEQKNVQMTPIQGLVKLNSYREDDIEGLILAVSASSGGGIFGDEPDRYMAYNVKPVFDLLRPKEQTELKKTTIEFRQHEGTIDGEMVTQWIKLLCGAIRWIERVEPSSLNDLLRIVVHETWSKTGDKDENARNELKYGPILAEGPFMITDLLEHMGMQESADYYSTRLYEVGGRPPSESTDSDSSSEW